MRAGVVGVGLFSLVADQKREQVFVGSRMGSDWSNFRRRHGRLRQGCVLRWRSRFWRYRNPLGGVSPASQQKPQRRRSVGEERQVTGCSTGANYLLRRNSTRPSSSCAQTFVPNLIGLWATHSSSGLPLGPKDETERTTPWRSPIENTPVEVPRRREKRDDRPTPADLLLFPFRFFNLLLLTYSSVIEIGYV